MSRSALTRFNKGNVSDSTGSVSYPPPPVYPPHMQAPYQAINAYYPVPGAVMAYPPTHPGVVYAMPQAYVPIRLTGDEDDIEDPQNRKSVVPQHGNSQFNINALLYQNIMENDYFKALYALKTYHEVLDEIRAVVLHVAPWATGTSRIPSSAFCLLLKLLLMKMTFKQMNGILNNDDNVYIRAIGFLYLRYSCPPNDLWKWFEPFIEDETSITPSSDKDLVMTIGTFCIKLLTDMSYFGTTLPRIPVPIERKIKVYLLLLEEKKKRRQSNLKYQERNELVPGLKVKAIYSDEENEPAWYDAVIDYYDESTNKYNVTFPEYGNKSAVDLGEIQIINVDGDIRKEEKRSRSRSRDEPRGKKRSRSRSDSRSRRRRSPHRGRSSSPPKRGRSPEDLSSQNLMEKVLQSSREASAAVGKNYGHRPASYKGSLSLKLDTYTARKKSPERGNDRRDGDNRRYRSRTPPRRSEQSQSQRDEPKPKSTTMSYEQQERMKKLKAAYGDASAGSN